MAQSQGSNFALSLVLRYAKLEPEERRNPQVATDYAKWFFGRLRGRGGGFQKRNAVRRQVYRCRYFGRLCAVVGGAYRSRQRFHAGCHGFLATIAQARRLLPGGEGRNIGRRTAEGCSHFLVMSGSAGAQLAS